MTSNICIPHCNNYLIMMKKYVNTQYAYYHCEISLLNVCLHPYISTIFRQTFDCTENNNTSILQTLSQHADLKLEAQTILYALALHSISIMQIICNKAFTTYVLL